MCGINAASHKAWKTLCGKFRHKCKTTEIHIKPYAELTLQHRRPGKRYAEMLCQARLIRMSLVQEKRHGFFLSYAEPQRRARRHGFGVATI